MESSHVEISDEELLAKSRLRPRYFEVLVERYQAAFARKAQRILRDPRDAEEVVLDAFTKIYLNADRFEPQAGATFSSWGYRILMNTAFTRYQKRLKEGQRFADLDPEFEQYVAAQGDQATRLRSDAVERVLARLPGHFAAVLRLYYLERWSQQDIADHLGEQVGAVKVRVHRAKAAFKRMAHTDELESLLEDR